MHRCASGELWMGESVNAIFCAVLKSDRACSSSLSTGVEIPDVRSSKDVLGWMFARFRDRKWSAVRGPSSAASIERGFFLVDTFLPVTN
jgi:hypothetical protein